MGQVPHGSNSVLTLGRVPARPRRVLRPYPYLSILPPLLVIAAVSIYPVIFAGRLSLHRYILTDPLNHPFTGLRNFAEALGSYYFARSLITTAQFTASVAIAVIVYGVLVGLYLNRSGRLAAFLRGAVLLPWAIPPVMAGILWKWIFNGDFGVLNAVLEGAGIIPSYVSWFGDPVLARLTLVTAQERKSEPQTAVMCLATLQVIPRDLYEAAYIDGGGSWATFRHITLPFLRPTLLILLILETIGGFVTFDLVYVMTGGGPADATSLVAWYAYAEIFRFLNLGKGAALAFLIAAITLVLALAYVRLLRSEEMYA
ncbi:MAG: sugar ABC transporter permease [Candidatus Omnitrophota bacterium]|nr:sugar ABC transporter permease [Candidatus Omnitrophota bacterium]